MRVEEVISYKFTDKNFIKDYKETAAILDNETRKTIKLMNESKSQA